jgi:hypothetical protein
MDFVVLFGRELEAAMPHGRMRGDACGIDRTTLRRPPPGVSATGNVATAECTLLLEMLCLLEDMHPKRGLVGQITAMAEEVRAVPFRHRPGDPPASDEMVPAIPVWRHGIGVLADEGDEHAIGATAKRSSRGIRGF